MSPTLGANSMLSGLRSLMAISPVYSPGGLSGIPGCSRLTTLFSSKITVGGDAYTTGGLGSIAGP